MLDWFIQWTTQLHETNHLAFAAVTVLTMVAIGVAIAVAAELVLKRLSGGRSGAPGQHHSPGH